MTPDHYFPGAGTLIQQKLGVRATSAGADDPTPPVSTGLTDDLELKERVRCAYVKTADTTEKFSSPGELNPSLDPDIKGAGAKLIQQWQDVVAEFPPDIAARQLNRANRNAPQSR